MGKGIRQNRFVSSQKGLALKVRRMDLRGEGLEGSYGGLGTGKAGPPTLLSGREGGPAIPFLDAVVGVLIAILEGGWQAIKLRSKLSFRSCTSSGVKNEKRLDFRLHQSLTVHSHLITN